MSSLSSIPDLEPRIAALTARRETLTREAEELVQAITTREDVLAAAMRDGHEPADTAAAQRDVAALRESETYHRKAIALITADLAPLVAEQEARAREAARAAAEAATTAVETALTALDATLRRAIAEGIRPALAAVQDADRHARLARSAAGRTESYAVPWHRYPELRDLTRSLERYASGQLGAQINHAIAEHVSASAAARADARETPAFAEQ